MAFENEIQAVRDASALVDFTRKRLDQSQADLASAQQQIGGAVATLEVAKNALIAAVLGPPPPPPHDPNGDPHIL